MAKNDMKTIGIFDTGIGGLSVAKSVISAKIFENIIYYGDTARVPYGSKNPKTIIKYALEAVEYFEQFNIDLLIVACNSVSAYAIDKMREKSTFDIIGVIEPGVLDVLYQVENKNSKILITGTKATIDSKLYKELLQNYGFTKLYEKATPLLVPLVEENILDGKIIDETFKMYFKEFINNIDAIILGCTHYPFLEKKYQEFFKNIKIIHSGKAIVKYLQNKYDFKVNTVNKTNINFFASDDVESLKNTANNFLR